MEALTLEPAPGTTLAASLFRPSGTPRAAVLIGGAMGVRQDYYRAFATWLAGQGYLTLTFDYRGSGASRPAGSLRGYRADLFDWARDTDAAVEALAARAGGLKLLLIGHSLGAQLPGLLAQRDRIDGLLSVAAGSGYWRDNAPQLRRIVPYFWHVLVPVATTLFGYFPGRRLGKVGDLPRGVVLQWRRWCMHPQYHVGAEGVGERFAAARFRILALSMTDDEMMTERGTHTLVGFYANAPRRVERIAPADVQARRIGHFGFFREQFQPTLWQRSLHWLRELHHPTLQETPA
ncbi:MAG: alpha/beta fold hydrolase [Piscinibacter sp.]|nr:alpha/beta fold hydrolase [Piscinibacter sp.]